MPVIRRGEPGDLAEVAAIQAGSPQAGQWNSSDYLQYDFWVALCDGRVVGFLVSRALCAGEAEVLNIVVAPEFRGRNIAHLLLKPLLEGDKIVYLEVRESNRAARSLYKSLGFKEISVRVEYYDSPPESAIVMKFHSC
jgi:[ribosomal protein S18]-alanine N-acetyltransferase